MPSRKNKRGHLHYEIPVYFSSDWMNEFWSFRSDVDDDFRFVYVGKKGTWTPLHADVYRSYSWSANISGVKRWWFFAPGEEKKLCAELGSMPTDVRECSSDALEHVTHFVFDQHPGQIVFVPSGWYHQVVNMTDCLSVNHNWFNANNIALVWDHVQDELASVEEATKDVQDTPGWHKACQVCLRALAGINFSELFTLLKYIMVTRWAGTRNPLLAKADEENVHEMSPKVDTPDNIGPASLQSDEVDRLLLSLFERNPGVVRRFLDEGDCHWRSCLLGVGSKSSSTEGNVSPSDWLTCHEFFSALKVVKDFVTNPTVKLLELNDGPLRYYLDQF